MSDDKEKSIKYAVRIMELARDTIMVRYRFFDAVLARFRLDFDEKITSYRVTGDKLSINPERLLRDYMDEPDYAVRLLMHIMFHGLFLHAYKKNIRRPDYWSVAADIAVENVILELGGSGAGLVKDDEELIEIDVLKKKVPFMTAEYIYRYFEQQRLDDEKLSFYGRLFEIDEHILEGAPEETDEIIIGEEQWRRIAGRVMTELNRFYGKKHESESLSANLDKAVSVRPSYAEVLKNFSVWGEEIKINPDEFDYVYYSHGLRTYGNMPLIEPLEYVENKKIRDFVVVIDTSASCSNAMIKQFLSKTYDVLSDSESFFSKINVHVIAADAQVQWEKKISSLEDMRKLASDFTLAGHGATDFRPAFEYTNELIKKKEVDNLKGLIYFTDGYGVYPADSPKYGVIFAFVGDDRNRPRLPSWAIEVILEEDDLDEHSTS